MNVKIKNQNMCFKITQDELKNLYLGKKLQTKINLLKEMLIVTIDPTGTIEEMIANINLDKNKATLNLQISPEKLKELSNMGRSRDGLQQNMDGVVISLQVDIRKQNS